jgi:membrane protease YdiL (CAAX protease family)
LLPATPTQQSKNLGVILRVGVFALIAILGYYIFPWAMIWVGSPFVIAALSTFAAAGVANAIVLRIYERGQLADIGLGWTAASRRNLALGILGGCGAGIVLLVSIVLLFGAVGEEMLFRGYGFQVLVKAIGPFATILPMGVLFGLAHTQNLHFTWVALLNTVLWGIVLGYAFMVSGDLWLPVGLHFGWNWVLPLLGANLSGFTMGVTGYVLHWKIGEPWSGGEYGPEGGWLTTVVVVALFLYLRKAPIEHQDAFLLREAP